MTNPKRKRRTYKTLREAAMKLAHDASFLNGDCVKASETAGCFYCCAVFPAAEVTSWITERSGGKTARCPKCGIDSILGSNAGYPLTQEFLSEMEKHWFAY